MNSRLISICLFNISFCLLSCKKIPAGKEIIVSGTVVDEVKNKNLTNATVLIIGCKVTMYGKSCTNIIDSAKTDENGEFSLKLNTEGKSVDYIAEVKYDENYDFSSSVKIVVGENKKIKITARELNYLKTHIKLDHNPYEPLINLSRNTRHILESKTIDTVVQNRVLPNAQNLIIYSIWDTGVGRYRRIIDTLNIGMSDTTQYSKILPVVNSWPLN